MLNKSQIHLAKVYQYNRENSKRNNKALPLKQAIEDMLELYKLRSKFNETYIVTYWEQIMGQPISSRTTEIYIKDRKLFVQLDSAPLRNELLMAKSKIVTLINKEVGEDIIEDVIFI
jgi:predicted nucleic acid-binding Zn ribbon protein